MHSKEDIISLHCLLRVSSYIVRDIIDELCVRDSRFQVIQESILQFQMGDDLDGLFRSFVELLKRDEESNTKPEALEPLEDIWQRHEDAVRSLNHIILAAIYEIMDAFAIEIAVDQIPALPRFDVYVELLKNLFSLSKNRPVLSVSSPRSDERSDKSREAYTYRYTNSLARLSEQTQSKKIRVLHLLPGSGRNRITCRLEVQDLRHGIDEALSYVWGKLEDPKCIWVDDQPFQITSNLYEILFALRRPSITRTLWIDAICINQSDLEEKSHQVRLMGEIYSNARLVTIWLSARSPDLNRTPDPYNPMAPLPSNFGRKDVDQYDVVSIMKWTDQLLEDNSFERDHLVAWVLIAHWVNAIMSYEWWERVWTIQEAVLPANHPKIILGAYEFSFGDVILAMNAMKRLHKMVLKGPFAFFSTHQGALTPDNEFLLRAFGTQFSHYRRLNYTRLLPYLRPGHDDDEFQSLANPIRRNLEHIISATSHYRATDPRDKYFALQALLRNSTGKLMYTNYNESTEAVFKRATARCYNISSRSEITVTFDLFIESPQATGNNASIPSWVHDFTYSDVYHHASNHGDKVTFRGYMRDEEKWNPRYNPELGICRCLATPKTLFCSGLSIDSILTTGLIPSFGDSDYLDEFPKFLIGVKKAYERYRSGAYGWDLTDTKRQHDTKKGDSDTASLSDASVSTGLGQENMLSIFEPDSSEQKQHKVDGPIERIINDLNPITDIMNLFTLGGERSLQSEVASNKEFNSKERQAQHRVSGLAGKQFFTTEKGLVGISTAPVKEGDTLAVMDASPAYYIFREVKASNGRSYLVQRHRIVARAVINENKDKMEKRFVGLEAKMFQVV